MVLTTLKALDQDGPQLAAGCHFLETLQEEDGSWYQGDALATACAITGLAVAGTGLAVAGRIDDAVRRGLRFLLLSQEPDGLWPPGIFVRVKTPPGFHQQRSREITGAFCIKAVAASLLGGRLPWLGYE
jgi:squalene cyclase